MTAAITPADQAYVASQLELLTPAAVDALRAGYPATIKAYLEWMGRFGWGSLDGAFMLYSGPVPLGDLLGERAPSQSLLAIGDDLAGYVVGFDPADGAVLEFDPSGQEVGRWRGFDHFIGERVAQIRADLTGSSAQ